MSNINEKSTIGFWSKHGYLEMLFFYLHPLGLGCWLVRIPDVKDHLNLDKAELATTFLGFPLGSILALSICTSFIKKFQIKSAWIIGHVSLSLGMPLVGFVNSEVALFIVLMWMGFFLLWTQLGINLQLTLIEKEEEVHVMSRCHGFFMAGLLSGSLIGVFSSTQEFSLGATLIVTNLIAIPIGVIAIIKTKRRLVTDTGKTRLSLPSKGFAGIMIHLAGCAITEGVITAWATIFVIEYVVIAREYAGLGLTFFLVAFAFGRMTGDHLKQNLGTVKCARIFCSIAIVALFIILLATNFYVLSIGYCLLGLGISLGFPYAMSAIPRISLEATNNAAWLMFFSMLSFQLSPAIIGYIAEVTSLKISFLVLFPLLVSTFYTARYLQKSINF